MASTLENTRKWLNETATAGSTSARNVATPNRVIHLNLEGLCPWL